MAKENAYVIGVDYGTDSVRTIIANTANGEEVASAIFYYPRWKKQLYCNAAENQFRQHPLDYLEGLEVTIRECVKNAGTSVAANIRALSVDTTGSTPIAVDKSGTPLSLLSGFEDNPNAMFVLWKDHTAIEEASEINIHAKKFDTNYIQFVGGIYSSEWFWAKLLHLLREDKKVRDAIYSFVEHCDWIPYLLTGKTDISLMKRGICAAGHKVLWADEWEGLPPNDFFSTLDPLLDGFTDKLFTDTFTADKPVGTISAEWATRLGLPENMKIGGGAFDCHMGAVGGEIEPYHLSKVMGTSTCDMMVASEAEVAGKLIKGICGQVPGSIIPGMIGLEAGQSAFGDAYAWYKQLITWPLENIFSETTLINEATRAKLIAETADKIIPKLSELASLLPVDETSELGIDWLNGRRTPDANQLLTASFTGLNLGTDTVSFFRAVVESTCFGAKAIVDRFTEQGIPVKGLIGLGGVAKKSPFIMQMLADVINMPIRVLKSEQTCALGAAMFAATVAGVYEKVEDAMKAMGHGFDATYHPHPDRVKIYEKRYKNFKEIGAFMEAHISRNTLTAASSIIT